MQVFATKIYERAISKLISEDSRQEMEAAIVADPTDAPVIPGTGGIRKFRWAGSGRGQRSGIRTIYFHHARPKVIYMLTVCAKAARDDLSPSDKRALTRLVATIKGVEKTP